MRNLFETVVDVGSGLFLSTLIQLLIFPYFDLYIQLFGKVLI